MKCITAVFFGGGLARTGLESKMLCIMQRSNQAITHSLFHSRLKSFLFCKSSLPHPFLFFIQVSLYGFPRLFTVTSEHIRLHLCLPLVTPLGNTAVAGKTRWIRLGVDSKRRVHTTGDWVIIQTISTAPIIGILRPIAFIATFTPQMPLFTVLYCKPPR